VKLRLTIALVILASAVGVSVIQQTSAVRGGERTFMRLECNTCHFSGAGPNLTHVAKKYDRAFLERFIADPTAVYRERKGTSLNTGFMLMPNVHATPSDARSIVYYLTDLDKN